MSDVRASNMLDMLSGKVAGLQVIGNGGPLASTRVVIRGNGSLSGNNQPLYVICYRRCTHYERYGEKAETLITVIRPTVSARMKLKV